MKRGAITDRPWGLTLAALAAEKTSGELVVIAEGKRYALAFHDGQIVGAFAPGAADSVGRIALTTHLVSSTQVAEITRRIAAQPERDEIEVIAEVARLSKQQAETLRRRVITQRAARTFAIEQGTYALDDRVTPSSGGSIDVRVITYLGARLHISEVRLASELRSLGARFVLRLDAIDDLPKFGFTDLERPIVEALRSGTSLAELEATRRELDPRMVAAVIYTLVVCNACGDSTGQLARSFATAGNVQLRKVSAELPAGRTVTPMRLVNQRVTTKDREPPVSSRASTPTPISMQIPVIAVPRTMTPQPVISRTMTPQPLASGSSPELGGPPVMIPALGRPPTPLLEELQVISVRTPTKELDARDAFQRGEMAMRRDQLADAVAAFTRALQLAPDDGDYQAMLAWVKFCAAADKEAIANETRETIDRAIARAATSVTPRMCRGRVERMLGRDKDALRYFQQVLELQPRHSAATSEARVLELRLRR